MAQLTFSNIKIRAVAAAAPAYTQVVDTSDPFLAKFVAQMGISQRHISLTEQTALDLGYVALQQALDKADWDKDELDLIIFDSQTPDFNGGTGNAMLLHKYLNLREDQIAFDLSLGCPAFSYSLSTACSYLLQPTIKKVAVLNGDSFWWEYPDAEHIKAEKSFVLGEATGVVLLERCAEVGATTEIPPLSFKLFGDGAGYHHLYFCNTGIKHKWRHLDHYLLPDDEEFGTPEAGFGAHYMDGFAITYFATKKVGDQIKALFGEQLPHYDYYVFHQANKQIITNLTKRLALDPSKVLISFDQYANTSAASSIVTICHNLTDLERPCHIFNACMGVGLAWGYSDLVLEPNTVCPVVTTDHKFEDHYLRPL